jgi:flagellar motor switch protein FliN/FliY
VNNTGMGREILSQEELDALLHSNDNYMDLTSIQKDALGEVGNISYGTSATALSKLLQQRVVIDTPTIFLTTQQDLKIQHPIPYVLIEVVYKQGLSGSNILVMKTRDALIIADLMMGGDGTTTKTELSPMDLSAVEEAMNQMVGNAATSMSTLFSKRIDIEPPATKIVDFGKEEGPIFYNTNLNEQIVVISFKLQIGILSDSEVMLVIPYPFAVEMADAVAEKAHAAIARIAPETAIVSPVAYTPPTAVPPPPAAPVEFAEPVEHAVAELEPAVIEPESPFFEPEPPVIEPTPPVAIISPPVASITPTSFPVGLPAMEFKSQPESLPIEPVFVEPVITPPAANGPAAGTVQRAQFAQLGASRVLAGQTDIEMLLDIPLQLTVELGSARMRIKDILELGLGSVMELDKLAGDPVDIFANGRLIARGEVVVAENQFAIKVIDIIDPIERASTLQ